MRLYIEGEAELQELGCGWRTVMVELDGKKNYEAGFLQGFSRSQQTSSQAREAHPAASGEQRSDANCRGSMKRPGTNTLPCSGGDAVPGPANVPWETGWLS